MPCAERVPPAGRRRVNGVQSGTRALARYAVAWWPVGPRRICCNIHCIACASDGRTASLLQWRRDQPHARMSLPERLVAVAATEDGAHIVGGTEGGRIYLWEACSGAMLRSWEGHYRSLTHMAFTDDGSHLVTCSEDSLVRTWSCGQLLDYNATSALPPKPTNSWSYHTLPVTGLAVGIGGAAAYICTVSADRSLVVAQIPPAPESSGGMHEGAAAAGSPGSGNLATVAFPSSLTAVALHLLDRSIYVVPSTQSSTQYIYQAPRAHQSC